MSVGAAFGRALLGSEVVVPLKEMIIKRDGGGIAVEKPEMFTHVTFVFEDGDSMSVTAEVGNTEALRVALLLLIEQIEGKFDA